MGKVKTKAQANITVNTNESWWGSGIAYDLKLDNTHLKYNSNKLEEANRIISNLELPKIDKDRNHIL